MKKAISAFCVYKYEDLGYRINKQTNKQSKMESEKRNIISQIRFSNSRIANIDERLERLTNRKNYLRRELTSLMLQQLLVEYTLSRVSVCMSER